MIKYRKKRPELPKWLYLDIDCCWWCKKNFNSCSGCGHLRKIATTKRSKENAQLRQARNKRSFDD